MRKTITILAMLLLASLVALGGSLLEEAQQQVERINAQDLPWTAVIPDATEYFESLGFSSWNDVSLALNQYRELPEAQIQNLYLAHQGARSTYTEDLLIGAGEVDHHQAVQGVAELVVHIQRKNFATEFQILFQKDGNPFAVFFDGGNP